MKADLLEVTHDGGSLMPAFGPDRLGEADVEAVLAYLDAVRRDRSEGAR